MGIAVHHPQNIVAARNQPPNNAATIKRRKPPSLGLLAAFDTETHAHLSALFPHVHFLNKADFSATPVFRATPDFLHWPLKRRKPRQFKNELARYFPR
jgi:hypothetical protein